MSRTSLHRPRRHPSGMAPPGHRHAPLSLPLSTQRPPTHPPLQALPQGPSPPPPQRSITVPPGPRDRLWKIPGQNRLALSKGPCQVRAPLTRRIRFASSGDALEHSVMSPPWAIAPPPDSPGLDLAGESEQSDNLRLKTNAPFRDSTVVTIGELRSTNAGHGSTLPSLRVVGHFWWSRLPHTEIISRLLHVLSEARGCRKAGVDVEHPLSRTTPIGTGVAVFLRNRPGPSIPSPFLPLVPFPCRGDRPVALGWGSPLVPSPSLPLVHFPSRDDRPVAQGVDAPNGASTPLPRPKKGTAH